VPLSARRALGAVVAVLGIALAVAGAWTVVLLGPSGEAQFDVTAKAPGAIVVTSDMLNSVDVPVRVTATRRDGGALRLAAAPSTDASAVLAGSAVSTVSGLHLPAGTLDLRTSGAGPVRDIKAADVWRLAATGAGSAELVVDQTRAPESAVAMSGDSTALGDVTMTLTWADRRWFFEALAVAMVGAVIAAFALSDLWQGRAGEGPTYVLGTTTSEGVR
jgi:hypothetical protein